MSQIRIVKFLALIALVLAGCDSTIRSNAQNEAVIRRTRADGIICSVQAKEFGLEIWISDLSGTQLVVIPDSETIVPQGSKRRFATSSQSAQGTKIVEGDYLILNDTTILVAATDFKYRLNTYLVRKNQNANWSCLSSEDSKPFATTSKLDCECAVAYVDNASGIVAIHTAPIPVDDALDDFYVNVFFFEIDSVGFQFLEKVRVNDMTASPFDSLGDSQYEAELYSKASILRAK